MKKALNVILVLAITALVAACKLAIIVVEGGEVVTPTPNPEFCAASAVCIQDVSDTSFTEVYTAVPDNANGWYFQKWNVGDRFFCGGSTGFCILTFEGVEDSPAVEEIVASNEMFYLMPVFKQFPNTITVDGKQWHQPYSFKDISWEEINSVCPAGACAGMLNGYDMTGWTWAATEDVNSLFNYYIALGEEKDGCSLVIGGQRYDTGSEPLGPGPSSLYCSYGNTAWARAFFSDGWRPTYFYLDSVRFFDVSRVYGGPINGLAGWMSDQSHPAGIILNGDGAVPYDEASTTDRLFNSPYAGGWFYRIPQS